MRTTLSLSGKLSLVALPALLVCAAPAQATAGTCTGTPLANLSKTWTKGDKIGDDNFGAGYTATATVNGKRDGLAVDGSLTADGSIFGNDQNLVKVLGNASAAVVGRSASENIDVFVMGKNVFHHGRSTGTSDGSGVHLALNKDFSVSFFDASKRFWLGPIPVRVHAAANGSAGFAFESTIGILQVDARLTPTAKAFATASCSADIAVAEAGVEGNVTLVDAGVPTTGQLTLTTDGINYQANSDLTLTYLAGRLNIFAKAFIGRKYEKKIADWSGSAKNYPLVHETGCVNLF
jgi:hypothetical protein